ncbi:AsnC family transcriptional regulator [Leucobacter luti]|uniref:AsnC family transcriptional regulator n=1 Tax=Leucobacter luti TaxID=340320 RepID=A0A4R6RWP6_9MICO|nr:Lrp/AsnC family transcriptional regulator [Leucobacter luti]TDP91469.1 AsnC family transcriptional regulator [Leucobacter luti]
MTQHSIDDLDRAIIRELEADGRRALREVARTVGTSEATVRARVKRLRELNLLRIIAFADPREIGGLDLALVAIKVEPARHADVVAALVAMEDTSYVSTLLGETDISCEIQSRDNQHLWEILHQQIATIAGVVSLTSQPILAVHKLGYQHPVTPAPGTAAGTDT